ncbi:MAG: metallophosphoesterase family protein [Bryobacter sp.]|nr:metallophosphoesterase family protein [Bryobacter sp.]
MNRRSITLLLTAGLACLLLAQGVKKYSEKLNHAPLPVPDRVILTWSADPTTTQSFTWRTDVSVTKPVVEYAEITDGPLFVKKVQKVEGTAAPFESELSTAHYHSATITGLKPGATYNYRVGDGENWSEWNRFRTAAAQPEPFEFLYFGDAQNNIAEHVSHLFQTALRHAPKARFLVHAGDLINNYNNDAQWGEWHRAMSFMSRSIPSVPAPGNHEYGNVGGKRGLTKHWAPQFTLPRNGAPGYEEASYYVDFQGLRMIALDSNRVTPEQTAWLENTLKNNPNRWTILTFHHPVLSAAKGRDNAKLREAWKPLIDRYKVDMVLTGHDHTYARSNLENNTAYVVSVVGPKQYDLEKKPWMVRTAEDTQLFQIIRINGNKLIFESRVATGELYDSFEITKQGNGANKLVNRIPGAKPENHRGAKTSE